MLRIKGLAFCGHNPVGSHGNAARFWPREQSGPRFYLVCKSRGQEWLLFHDWSSCHGGFSGRRD
jgi:hypothetical protein